MESRLIYSIVNSGQLDLEWQNESNGEWISIGTDEEIKKDFVLQKLKETFEAKRIFIVLGRTNSKEVSIGEFESEIRSRIGKESFLICDKLFSKFIEFSSIGVMRIGRNKKHR